MAAYEGSVAEVSAQAPVVAAATALAEHWRQAPKGGWDYTARNAALLDELDDAVRGRTDGV